MLRRVGGTVPAVQEAESQERESWETSRCAQGRPPRYRHTARPLLPGEAG